MDISRTNIARKTARFWSDEEKLPIRLQTCTLDVCETQVAPQYAMNTDLLQTCLHYTELAADPEVGKGEVALASSFLCGECRPASDQKHGRDD